MKNKSRFRFLTLIILLFISGANGTASAKVYIDVGAPDFQQFPIAICDFQNKKTGTSPSSDSDTVIADNIRRYLDMSGIFNILDKRSFLEGVEPGTPETIRFSDWSVIGADFLLRGNILTYQNDVLVESRLYDVTRGQRLFNNKYPGKPGDLQSVARKIASDILFALTGDGGDFNTRIAFVIKRNVQSDIVSMTYDASDMINLTHHRSIVMSPRWSPDGQYLALTSYKDGRPAVYLRDLQTGKEKKVSSFHGLNLCGSFSPDSRKLLLTLSKDGNEEIYSMDIDSLSLKRLTNSFSIDVSPAWSPDGKKIAFVSNRSGSPQIFVMDADGSNVRRITFKGNYNTSPAWSPRGGRIAYEGLSGGNYQIFSVDEDGNNLSQLTFDDQDNEYPSWSPSGRQIAYSSRRGSVSFIKIINSNGTGTRVLKESKDHLVMPSWSPRFK